MRRSMRVSPRAIWTSAMFLGAAFLVLLTCAGVAHADYTLSSCGSNYNENVFSAVLPPGGSVITSGSGCPSGPSRRAASPITNASG